MYFITQVNGTVIQVPPDRPVNMALYEYPGLVSSAQCTCVQTKQAQTRIDNILNGKAGVPEKYRTYTFETWDAMPAAWRADKGEARKACGEYAENGFVVDDSGEQKIGLVLAGHTGTGKSGLTAATMWGRVQLGVAALWIDFRMFVRQARHAMSKDAEFDYEDVIGSAANAPLLIWDDFSDEAKEGGVTDFLRDLVYDIVSTRYNDHLPLLMNTNLDPDLLYEQWDHRIGDRILKLCHWQPLEGRNLRFTQQFTVVK